MDLALNARFVDGKLGPTLGVDNLFDQYPDRVPDNRVLPNPPGGTVNLDGTNALGSSRHSPYGFSGRFVYARFGYQWQIRAAESNLVKYTAAADGRII